MATPRVAAGALFFDEHDRILIVHPTYKTHWDIPGGYVEPGESPAEACRREVNEELAIKPALGRLLVVDWAPNDGDGDKLLFVFDGGRLSERERDSIRLPGDELHEWRFVTFEDAASIMIPRLTRRLSEAISVRRKMGRGVYLEHGIAREPSGA